MTARAHRDALRQQRLGLGLKTAVSTLWRIGDLLSAAPDDDLPRYALGLCMDAVAVLGSVVRGGEGVLPLARKLAVGAGEFVGRLEREGVGR